MKRVVTCYPQPGKRKAIRICEAFAAGVGACGDTATISVETPKCLMEGDAFFYGVRPFNAHLFAQCKVERRVFWYADNSYFDVSREKYFRITRNAMQCDGLNATWSEDGGQRLKALGITISPWQKGSHIVLCPQSEEFTRICGGFDGDWLGQALSTLRNHTRRELRVRRKGCETPLRDDLLGAHALVTHMSCAAVEALVAGVPVFCTGRSSAQWMGSSDLTAIETPLYPERRQEWAELLAANEWTLDELRSGVAWRALNPR